MQKTQRNKTITWRKKTATASSVRSEAQTNGDKITSYSHRPRCSGVQCHHADDSLTFFNGKTLKMRAAVICRRPSKIHVHLAHLAFDVCSCMQLQLHNGDAFDRFTYGTYTGPYFWLWNGAMFKNSASIERRWWVHTSFVRSFVDLSIRSYKLLWIVLKFMCRYSRAI